MRNFLLASILTLPFLIGSCQKKDDGFSPFNAQIIKENSSIEEDQELLDNLYEEILVFTNQEHCTDASEWNYTELGSKACGGPVKFIAYSNKIDTAYFLNLVKHYNEQQHNFNIKWGIFSDCSIPAEPNGINCVNNQPVFYYD